jgi:hypothetical protein
VTWEPEWMATPEGPRFRMWCTVTDWYQSEAEDLETAALTLAERRVRWDPHPQRDPRQFVAQARERLQRLMAEEPPSSSWTPAPWCVGCGGWSPDGNCYGAPDDAPRCGPRAYMTPATPERRASR